MLSEKIFYVLTLRQRTVFFNFEKAQAISLYCFAAQKQASTSRRQKYSFFYLKLSAKFNEVSVKF